MISVLLHATATAQLLLTTRLGEESAVGFCMRGWNSTRQTADRLLITSVAIEPSWRQQITAAASAHDMKVVLTQDENLLRSLAKEMHSIGTRWAMVIPASSAFLNGEVIDACLSILPHTSAQYVRGIGFPTGASPLALRSDVVNTLASRDVTDEEFVDSMTWLLDSLLTFHGIGFPAPPQLNAPDLNLSLTSAINASELETITQHLADRQRQITTRSVIEEMRKNRRIRLRQCFRLAQKRPLRRTPASALKRGVLCLCARADKVGGGETSLDNLFIELDRNRFHPLLASPYRSGTLVDVWRARGIPTIAMPLLTWLPPSSPSELLLSAMRLARFGSRNGADLIYGNNTVTCKLGALTSFMLGVPLVARVISDLNFSLIDTSLTAFATRVVVPSNYIANHCRSLGIPSERLRVVHEGLSSVWFTSPPEGESVRHLCGFPDESQLIGVVSRLGDPAKSLDRAIEAIARVVAQYPAARAVICGKTGRSDMTSGELQLRQLIEQWGLTNHVRLVGFVTDMRTVYPQFDLLLHTAPREPFGLALTEAMAMGVPPIAIRGGGAPEQIQDGIHGILVARDDPQLLAQAALQLLMTPSFRQQLGQQAREHVRRHFTSERFAREIEAVFDEVLVGG